jgi:hypothetical protein
VTLSSHMGSVSAWMPPVLEWLRDSPIGTPKVLDLDISDLHTASDSFLEWIQRGVDGIRRG